jgi:transglutaminase-like putative cysteine protease
MAAAALLAAWIRRFALTPAGGQSATVAITLGAVVACGSIRSGPVYPWFVVLFTLASVVALWAARASSVSWLSLTPVRKTASAGAWGVAIVVAVSLAWSLPKAHERIIRGIGRWNRPEMSGFSDRIDLGGAVDLTESDKVVLRIEGGRVDYLRGATWQRYVRGEWRPWPERGAESSTGSAPRTQGPATVLIRPQTSNPRYFLPIDAAKVDTETGKIVADGAGIFRAPWGEEAGAISFALGPREAFPIKPPIATDVDVPEPLRSELERIARAWVQEPASVRDKLVAIERMLMRNYTWSLHHRRATRGDPVIDFLVYNRVGHCEYFASSMALLARSLGIPARVVGGYRVTEHNALGGYDVVREWNAHAWVEAWIPERGWTTFDPTPGASVAAGKPATTPWPGAAIDLLLSGVLTRWVATPSGRWIAGVGLIAAGAYLLRRRLAHLLGRGAKNVRGPDPNAPLASMQALLDRLARVGYPRPASEPLDRFAQRLRVSGRIDPSVPEAIEQYARLRYGDIGVERQVDAAVQAAAGRTDSLCGPSSAPDV